MHRAELVIHTRPKAIHEVLQTAEVVGDQQEHAGESSVFEFHKDCSPGIDGFVVPERFGAKDFFAGLEVHADDQEMNRFFDRVVVILEIEFLGVDIQDEPVGRPGALVKGLGFLFEFREQGFEFLAGIAQAQGLEGPQGRLKALGCQEDRLQEFLITFREGWR